MQLLREAGVVHSYAVDAIFTVCLLYNLDVALNDGGNLGGFLR